MLCVCACWAWPDWEDEVQAKWQVLSHQSGHWIINTGEQRLVVPSIPARWLSSLHGKRPNLNDILLCLKKGNETDLTQWSEPQIVQLAQSLAQSSAGRSSSNHRKTLWCRFPLISANKTRIMARFLERWTRKKYLALLLILGLAGPGLYLKMESLSSLGVPHWLWSFVLFFAGAILHELGHAAALSDQGYPAGGIGAGVLFVIPVLHNDVSAIAMLKKGGKLRVDLAGVVFQAAYAGGLVLGAMVSSSSAASFLLAAKMTWLAVGWSLIPFIRADGYWAFCDAMGIRDLSLPLEQSLGRIRMILLLGHRVLNIVFLIVVSLMLPLNWMGRLTSFVPESFRVLTWIVLGVVLPWIWWRMGRTIWGLVEVVKTDLRFLSNKNHSGP